jgi:4-hydroxybutyrate dehydrogenase
MEIILPIYQKIAKEGQKALYDNVGDLLLSSTYAGIAFGNTGVGAVHAMSYQIGGGYHVAHGGSNYAFFDGVLRMYEEKNPDGKIKELKLILADAMGVPTGADALKALDELLGAVAPLKRPRDYGVKEAEIETFSDATMTQERLMKNNYVPLSRADVREVFARLY